MPPPPEDRPDEDLRRLAELAVAAVAGDPTLPDADPATVRRVTAVVEAIEAAGRP